MRGWCEYVCGGLHKWSSDVVLFYEFWKEEEYVRVE